MVRARRSCRSSAGVSQAKRRTLGAAVRRSTPAQASRRSTPEIGKLRIQRSYEGRPRRAALEVGDEPRIELRCIWMEAQHCRHHQIAGGEALSIQERFAPQPLSQGIEFFVHELDGTRPAQLRPFVLVMDVVDDEDIPNRGFHGVECRDQLLDSACAGRGVLGQKHLRALSDMQNNRARLE